MTEVKLSHIDAKLDKLVDKVDALHNTVIAAQAIGRAGSGIVGFAKPLILGFVGAVLVALGFYPHVTK